MNTICFVALLSTAAFFSRALAQERPVPDTLGTPSLLDLESIVDQSTRDVEKSRLIDLLSTLEEKPIDLNLAPVEDLEQIPGITPSVALKIVTYRQKAPLRSIEELLLVEGVSYDLFLTMRKFVRVGNLHDPDESGVSTAISYRGRSTTDLEERKGFQDGSYGGSPFKIYNRLEMSHGRRQGRREVGLQGDFGFIAEKDAGESSLTNFTAGYARISIPSISTRLLVGDFSVEAAEGLVFWHPFPVSKSGEVISSARKDGSGVRPYLSTDENFHFRGLAVDWKSSGATLQVFYSNKPVHATVDSSGITSFYSGGLFRTQSELSRKNATQEMMVGLRSSVSPVQEVRFGLSAYASRFAHPLNLSQAKARWDRPLSVAGLDASYTNRQWDVFSEVAVDQSNEVGMVGGLLAQPTPAVDVALVARKYPESFLSIHGSGFGEVGGFTQNESGIYVAARMRLTSWLRCSFFYDQFFFPGPIRFVRVPSAGNDFLVVTGIQLTNHFTVQLHYKVKKLPTEEVEYDEVGRADERLSARVQRNYRVTAEYTPYGKFQWRIRFERVDISYKLSRRTESGMMLFEDVRYRSSGGLLVHTRIALFQTDSFDSRLYEFESDVPGAFLNSALFGKGVRWYIVAQYQPIRTLRISAKYSRTLHEGVKSLGSGPNAISGDLESQVSLQVEFNFQD